MMSSHELWRPSSAQVGEALLAGIGTDGIVPATPTPVDQSAQAACGTIGRVRSAVTATLGERLTLTCNVTGLRQADVTVLSADPDPYLLDASAIHPAGHWLEATQRLRQQKLYGKAAVS